MHSLLFAVSKPKEEGVALGEWHSLVRFVSARASTIPSVQPLGSGAWLFPGADGLPVLGEAVSSAREHKLAYRVLVVEKAYDWTPATTQ